MVKRTKRMSSRVATFLRLVYPMRRRGMRHSRHVAPHPLLLAVCTVGITGILAGCGNGLTPRNSPTPDLVAPSPSAYPVRFAPSVSYDAALRMITDLGLQPSVACGYKDDLVAGRVITDMQWRPAGQRSEFVRKHILFVTITPLTPTDWGARLTHTRGVVHGSLDRATQPVYCPDSANMSPPPVGTTHPSVAPTVLTYAQAASSPIALVVFTPSSTYTEALYTMSDLGLRLATPCYEREVWGNPRPSAPWPGGGQEQRFLASHELIVAAAPLTTPINWEQALSSQAGVAHVTIPYTAAC